MRKSLYTKHNQIFLSMLRDSRHRVRLRQSDLADILGLAQATVSKVERGERRLDVIELREWLAALGQDYQKFVCQLDERLGMGLGVGDTPVRRRRAPAAGEAAAAGHGVVPVRTAKAARKPQAASRGGDRRS